MAKSLPLFVGLDIGTGFIKIAAGQKKSGDDLEIIYAGQTPSRGVRRGVVFDVEAAAKCIAEAVEKAEMSLGHNVEGVYISVNGSHIFCASSRGLVSVSRADGKISIEDVDRVLQASRTVSLSSSNKEIIDVYPREFIVDSETGVKDAIGMKGVRLEAEVLIVAGFTPYLKNSDKAVLRAELEVLNRAPAAASSSAVLSEQQKELGAAVLDIGSGTTNMAVYEEGDLLHLAVLPMGSANITNDIAIGAKTDVVTAERIKIEKGTCFFKGADKKIKLTGDAGGAPEKVFSQRLVSKIIQERVGEIFELANKELKKIGREKKLPAGIVLCGGGVKLGHIEETAKKIFQLTVSVGVPRGSENIDSDPAMAAACGLANLGFKEQEEEASGGAKFSSQGGWEKVKKFFKIFVP